ncbi:glycine/betaine ABC transporter permease [Mycobacterium tuberculosis]|nr:glycine/betaine ABC transporter permease [Mycobacterium tuberculosis]CKX55259.1 glycine/betaine ABC transporter permease [Mycobacterium tuberculosis]CKY74984.1 glycine/betaine ABC transporter permease [Mycobacterium tuberculosis]
MNFLQQALSYLLTASNWTGPVGLAVRTCEHLEYTAVAVAASALIAVPVGLLIGHTGRGTLLVVGAVNGLRALPTLGVLLLGVLLFGLGLGPPLVALMLLGIPSLLASTYAGIASVDPLVVDAARAMGMTESQVLLRVEVPNALPLMLGGLRSATLQVGRHRDGGRLRQSRGAGWLLDRRDQGASIPHRSGRCDDGGRVGVDPRRTAGVGGVGIGAGHREDAQARRGCRQTCRRRWTRPTVDSVNAVPSDLTPRVWPAMLTWRAQDISRMESVRVQLSGKRIRANGRIVAAATANNPAFGAHYDLQTDETGATKRFGLTVTLAERERQLAIARDEENMWLVTDHQGERRAAYNGALDIDLVFSPFFNALPIRRLGLHERAESIALPVVYVNVPEMSVDAATVSYTSEGRLDGIKLRSPVADTTVTVDSDGFIVDYPGLAERM